MRSTWKLLFITLMVCMLLMSAFNLTAAEPEGSLISYRKSDLDMLFDSTRNIFLFVASPQEIVLQVDPDIIFETVSVSPAQETSFSLEANPGFTMVDSVISLDAETTLSFDWKPYLNGGQGMPIGFRVAPSVTAAYDLTTLDVDARLDLGFMMGRLYDRTAYLAAYQVAEKLGLQASSEVLTKVAGLIAGFGEGSIAGSSSSPEEMIGFFREIAGLLGVPEKAIEVRYAYYDVYRGEQVSGFEFDLNIKTTYDINDTQELLVAVQPGLTVAGSLGNTFWYDLFVGAELPSLEYDFGGGGLLSTFQLDAMDAAAKLGLSWYASPDIEISIDTTGIWSDPLDGSGGTLNVMTAPAIMYDISEGVELTLSGSVFILPSLVVTAGASLQVDIF